MEPDRSRAETASVVPAKLMGMGVFLRMKVS